MSAMTPRERFLAALSHEEPDRVPLDLGGINTTLMVGTYDRLKVFLGMDELPTRLLSKTWQIVEPHERILERLSIDTRYIFPKVRLPQESSHEEIPSEAPQKTVEDRFVDEWGITRRFIMHYYEIAEHPLREARSVEDIDSYPWPNAKEYLLVEGLREQARYLRQNTVYTLVGYIPGSLFEQAWYLRGYAELLMDFLLNKDLAHALFTRVLEVRKQNAEIFLDEVGDYLDVIQVGDDLATQDRPATSPALYREMVKPYQAELFRFVKERTPARLYYHSCGAVAPLIDDLIEIGVDALNPVQVSAEGMDTAELKARFGDQIAFWGAIDTQRVLPFGTTEQVRDEVRGRIDDLAPGGGYVLAGVHNLQPDIPPENIVAMYEEAASYGRYPLHRG
jgi:uroporphyrinogen decarboxylase